MPSPFPGMDPYLEDPNIWPGVHQRLITYIADELHPHVRPRYHARIGERLYVVTSQRAVYPDVTVVERTLRERAPAGVAAAPPTLTADDPVTIAISEAEYREPFVEIIHNASGDVVTVIEVLSPANKTTGPGREQYRQKQQEVLGSEAHLVEIDLLAEGAPTVAPPPAILAQLDPFHYLISVNRHPARNRFELYPFPLPERLPRPRIPLRAPDPDVVLDLPAVFTRCYDNGGYADFVDYGQPPPVPLSDAEHVWIEEDVTPE